MGQGTSRLVGKVDTDSEGIYTELKGEGRGGRNRCCSSIWLAMDINIKGWMKIENNCKIIEGKIGSLHFKFRATAARDVLRIFWQN